MKDKIHFAQFLLTVNQKEMRQIIKFLSKEKLQWVIEILYNVVQGVCPITDLDKKLLSKKKSIIRQLFSKQITLNRRKLLLVKLSPLLPIFLKICLKYVS